MIHHESSIMRKICVNQQIEIKRLEKSYKSLAASSKCCKTFAVEIMSSNLHFCKGSSYIKRKNKEGAFKICMVPFRSWFFHFYNNFPVCNGILSLSLMKVIGSTRNTAFQLTFSNLQIEHIYLNLFLLKGGVAGFWNGVVIA